MEVRHIMQERTVDLGSVVAIGLWGLTFCFLLVGTVVGIAVDNLAVCIVLCSHGLALSAAAATATVRCFFVTQNRLLRAAFELGKSSAVLRQVKGN